jgi:hypothetical protein
VLNDDMIKKFAEEGHNNTVLKAESENRYNFVFFPTLKINGQQFLGSWESRNILEAICSGYEIIPRACYDENMIIEPINREESKSNFLLIVVILLICCVFILVLIFCIKYITKKTQENLLSRNDFTNKVDDVVSKYFKMRDSDDKSASLTDLN